MLGLNTLEKSWQMLASIVSPLQFGAELEFYLPTAKHSIESTLLPGHKLVREKGQNQFEIILPPYDNPLMLAKQIATYRDLISKNHQGIFSAKPFANDYGSALQISIGIDQYLEYAIGGLCDVAAESMIFFAPHEESYQRFVSGFDAPTHISWGGNNRTVLIRVRPTDNGNHNRIEHRAPGADSDPYFVIAVILYGAYHGITKQISPPARIYGNAFDAQYQLPPLPQTLREAKSLFEQSQLNGPNFL
jgi:glutamine synthetase